MNDTNLISDGFQLMLVGMGMVFVFLSILVFITSLMEKWLSEPQPVKTNNNDNNKVSGAEIAAISSAIHTYRSKNAKQ